MVSNLAVGLPALAEQETWFLFSEWRSRGVPGGPENLGFLNTCPVDQFDFKCILVVYHVDLELLELQLLL